MPVKTIAPLDEPITQHLRRDVAVLRSSWTVHEALDRLRKQPPEGRIIYFYVVDDANHLVGVVPTRRLLLGAADAPVESIMVRSVITIPRDATVLDALEFFLLHKLLAFPVVDEHRVLLGAVDIDLFSQEQRELEQREQQDLLFQLIGTRMTDAQKRSPLASFRGRFPWLLCNIGGGLLAAMLSWWFEAELQKVIELALFIPVVLSLAEGVAIQSVSLALPMVHAADHNLRRTLGLWGRESATAGLLGVACGGLVAAAGWLFLGNTGLFVCLLFGITMGVTGGALVGVTTPSLLHLLRRDPGIAAGPVALACTDMITLLAYFGTARWWFA